MKSTTAIIIFLCIAVVTCVLLCIRHKKEYWGAIISSCLILGGFLAAIINAASPVITTIYGFDKNSYSKQKYFLFYKANLTPDKSKSLFLVPYGKGAILNDTDLDLVCYPIRYEEYKAYNPQLLPAHTINKVIDEPSYFFEEVPTRIITKSRSGKTKWVVLKEGDEITFKETFQGMKPFD